LVNVGLAFAGACAAGVAVVAGVSRPAARARPSVPPSFAIPDISSLR
jgi:hypothetical protein